MAFEFVFTTEEIREKMFDFLKNLRYGYDYTEIEWATGIFDREHNIFMTLIYFQSGLGHCYDTLKCIVIIGDNDIFIAHLYGLTERDEFEVPEKYGNLRGIVKEGLIYYDDFYYMNDYTDLPDEKKKEVNEIEKMMNDRLEHEQKSKE